MNSHYFHQVTNARRVTNSIKQLKSVIGIWLDWESGLDAFIVSYFRELFSSSIGDAHDVLGCVERRVTDEQNIFLSNQYSADEVKAVVFSMHQDKSPCPDGLVSGFYQHYWNIISSYVCFFSCLNEGCRPPSSNNTTLVLVLKKKNPEFVSDL